MVGGGDAQMEDEILQGFEIDVACEFDAPRYFDLGRGELPREVQQAELWFETSGNYPPSPLLAGIDDCEKGRHDMLDTLFDPNGVDSFNAKMSSYICPGSSHLCVSLAGHVYDVFRSQTGAKHNNHTTLECTCLSNPSFMNPTTSQLARQNFTQRVSTSKWFQKPLSAKSRSSEDPLSGLLHAAKRQKVAGGVICKVVGKPQRRDLLHKISKEECFTNCISHPTKMRLTIPREPMLETARRAKSFRAQRSTQPDLKEANESTFKALPLNRKILKGPSLSYPQKSTPKLPEFQEFKLRTSVRAFHHSMASQTSLTTGNLSSSSVVKDCCTGSKASECQPSGLLKSYGNKARGSIQKLRGLNREEKKLNFSTSKRNQQQSPLSELFNKLSLSSQVQQSNMSWADSESILVTTKGSKENVMVSELKLEGITFCR